MSEELEKYSFYLGDGVYASFDGYHVKLAANHHENIVIALEPEVIQTFIEYLKKHKMI